MNRSVFHIFRITLLCGLLSVHGCKSAGDSSIKMASTPSATTPVQGTIVNKTGLDGCFYLIELANGKYLEADIPAEFQKDGLKVWISFTPQEKASACMASQGASLVSIVKASDVVNTQGIIVDRRDVDGCQFLIKLKNGDLLEANVPEKFRTDGLTVDISYAKSSGKASICMMGTIITLVAIGSSSER